MNQHTIMGRLGADPEIHYTTGGAAIVTIRVATDRRTKRGGEWQTATDWHRCKGFGKTAEAIKEHFRKGSKILLQGPVIHEKWTDQQGRERWSTDTIIDRFEFVDPKSTTNHHSAPPDRAHGYDGDGEDIPF